MTTKLVVDAYRDIKSRGFTDEMIHLMINGQLDVNYDGKIGLTEAIYIMQKVAGMR